MLNDIESIEKSNVMEDHYSKSDDPWGNRELGLYRRKLDKAIKESYEFVDKKNIKVYDVGVGGGSVLDAFLKNKEGYEIALSGGDISPSAIDYINKNYEGSFNVVDYEEYQDDEDQDKDLSDADLISFIDVMYYFDLKRYYKRTLDQLWKTIKPGAVVLVADTLIPYQRRSYLGTKEDCELLDEFIDSHDPVGENPKRNLKIKIYRKTEANKELN